LTGPWVEFNVRLMPQWGMSARALHADTDGECAYDYAVSRRPGHHG
jgi:hypothetical protein